jgi:hypothetical protein
VLLEHGKLGPTVLLDLAGDIPLVRMADGPEAITCTCSSLIMLAPWNYAVLPGVEITVHERVTAPIALKNGISGI